jgi:hypothetical protein
MSDSTRLQVLKAVKALVAAALPDADVVGLDAAAAKPDRIGPGGSVVVRAGDPGDPEVDLSPLTYNYEHEIPLEIGAYESGSATSEEVLDAMMRAIGAAIEADRTLGGLCTWLEATAPETDDFDAPGAVAGRWAEPKLVASYATRSPLN